MWLLARCPVAMCRRSHELLVQAELPAFLAATWANPPMPHTALRCTQTLPLAMHSFWAPSTPSFGCVFQAAATGETLLDEELSSLARKNVGRFHSLNQRLQAQGAAGPSR